MTLHEYGSTGPTGPPSTTHHARASTRRRPRALPEPARHLRRGGSPPSPDRLRRRGRHGARPGAGGGRPGRARRGRTLREQGGGALRTQRDHYHLGHPDGTLTTELAAGPVRFDRDGAWVPVDTDLTERPDGTVAAKAHPAALTLAGKGGSRAPSLAAARTAPARDLVTLGEGDRQVTLQ
ncbi:hypothetical protein [Streptomyces sp. cmx-4-7]|uniref:hypothetical protein n=1 Tax=Streptomyces sp. cmx-4-7 TaxID=2790939 RepID=UPI00397FE72F